MKQNKTTIILAIACIIVGAGAFYGGMKYGQSKNNTAGGRFQNLSPEDRQARMKQFQNGGQAGGAQRAGGFITGEILSKDEKMITMKLQEGGSKIILFSDSTKIAKSSDAAAEDLQMGGNIAVNGSINPDGSITADNIQIRPAFPRPNNEK